MEKKIYEVTFDVVGSGTLFIEAVNAEQAYTIACEQNINIFDYAEGIEIVHPTESDVIDPEEYELYDYDIIKEDEDNGPI